MGRSIGLKKVLMAAMLIVGATTFLGGCATKKYVRTSVDTVNQELSAKISESDKGIANNSEQIKASSSQIGELNEVAREQGQKISGLDSATQQAQSDATRAKNDATQAQGTASKAADDIVSLDGRFQNRNHFMVLDEEQVLFKFNSAVLEPDFKQALDEVAQMLKENPDLILVMEGHTDSTGPDVYNIELGKKRLEAVMRYLVVEMEVPVHRISEMSFGEARPINPEKTREARMQNRSVLVRVMGPQLSDSDSAKTSDSAEDIVSRRGTDVQ